MARAALLALAVGLVLADSSVVTLGLPDVLADFDVSPEAVAWVLTAYNLVLAVVAVPAALALRSVRSGRGEGGLSASALAGGGLVVFAAASLLCAVAPNLAVLIAGRCLQGLGGAAVALRLVRLHPLSVGGLRRGRRGSPEDGATGRGKRQDQGQWRAACK